MSTGSSRLERSRRLLPTERRNPRTLDIDTLNSMALVTRLTNEELKVARAIRAARKDMTCAVETIVDKLGRGGRLIYLGAGTSGRICVLDAASCNSTFGVPRTKVMAIIAEKSHTSDPELSHEDDGQAAENELRARVLAESDVVFGVAASGRTPFVVSGIRFAKNIGAATIGLTANASTPLAILPDVVVIAPTGAESLTGSTRMKAGTAQKVILNIISTATMVLLGKTYSNLMVDLIPRNEKLRRRAIRIVSMATGAEELRAAEVLQETGNVKLAILRIKSGENVERCREALSAHGDVLRAALASVSVSD